ncbi:MAG: hypothetical protein AMJ81_00935 [Phycisphaerae bacterium SM23_33]|nr:MAG: hypothetical protein AMJ81_00935 [Phycisphaerae bacterium SM23_33]
MLRCKARSQVPAGIRSVQEPVPFILAKKLTSPAGGGSASVMGLSSSASASGHSPRIWEGLGG